MWRTYIHIASMFLQSCLEKWSIMEQAFCTRNFDSTRIASGISELRSRMANHAEKQREVRSPRSGGKSHVIDRTLGGSLRPHFSFMRLAQKTFGLPLRSRIRARWVCSSTKNLHTQVCRRPLSNHAVSNRILPVSYDIPCRVWAFLALQGGPFGHLVSHRVVRELSRRRRGYASLRRERFRDFIDSDRVLR